MNQQQIQLLTNLISILDSLSNKIDLILTQVKK